MSTHRGDRRSDATVVRCGDGVLVGHDGTILPTSVAAWRAFLDQVRAGRFDRPAADSDPGADPSADPDAGQDVRRAA